MDGYLDEWMIFGVKIQGKVKRSIRGLTIYSLPKVIDMLQMQAKHIVCAQNSYMFVWAATCRAHVSSGFLVCTVDKWSERGYAVRLYRTRGVGDSR